MVKNIPLRSRVWDASFQKLEQFKAKHGHTNVSRHDSEFEELADWIEEQRKKYKNKLKGAQASVLTKSQQQKLESIGFHWDYRNGNRKGTSSSSSSASMKQSASSSSSSAASSAASSVVSPDGQSWHEMLQEVVEYHKDYGHFPAEVNSLGMSSSYRQHQSEDNDEDFWHRMKLLQWIKRQRKQYAASIMGEKTALNERQINELKSIGLIQNAGDVMTRNIDVLLLGASRIHEDSFVSRNQRTTSEKPSTSLDVLAKTASDGNVLPKRVSENSRSSYIVEPTHDISLIQANEKADPEWDMAFRELYAFKQVHDHCVVDQKDKSLRQLAEWCDAQRQRFEAREKGNSLSLSQIARLDSIGFFAGPVSWDEFYAELLFYRNQFGHCNVPVQDDKYRALAYWVIKQREDYHKIQGGRVIGGLNNDRIKKLEEINFCWEGISKGSQKKASSIKSLDCWESGFELLKKFKEEHGHCLVPRHFGDFRALGLWVSEQRRDYVAKKRGAKSSLSFEQVQLLDEIQFMRHDVTKTNYSPQENAGILARAQKALKISTQIGVKEDDPRVQQYPLYDLDQMEKSLDMVTWGVFFDALKQFKQSFGDCNVSNPKSRLGKWVSRQRDMHKRKDRGPMWGKKEDQLASIGFSWTDSTKTKHSMKPTFWDWDDNYSVLKSIADAHGGDCNVPIHTRLLAEWMVEQRCNYSLKCRGIKTELDDLREAKLDAIGFDWHPNDDHFWKAVLYFRYTDSNESDSDNEEEQKRSVGAKRRKISVGKHVWAQHDRQTKGLVEDSDDSDGQRDLDRNSRIVEDREIYLRPMDQYSGGIGPEQNVKRRRVSHQEHAIRFKNGSACSPDDLANVAKIKIMEGNDFGKLEEFEDRLNEMATWLNSLMGFASRFDNPAAFDSFENMKDALESFVNMQKIACKFYDLGLHSVECMKSANATDFKSKDFDFIHDDQKERIIRALEAGI